ncbi:unnamed protein product [Cylindrotheca closterium]|uniref:Dienelactone hydrolase domain-containing protein n=1 Tax=Cylindrotheca closterium TaxID=2856 RepID=A0AAD2D1C9_9STRA|nr:unnamed protein product [Cylindrotheca closterium]
MSASSDCCPPGSHQAPILQGDSEAQSKGSLITLGESTPCYYTPAGGGDKEFASSKGIIAYTDVWGFQSRIHSLCDYLAVNGNFHVICVDCFRGETKDDHPDMLAWFQSVPYDPVVAKDTEVCREYLINKLNCDSIGAIGFCWGAWAIGKVFQQDGASIYNAAVAFHPSFKVERLAFGGDDIKLMQGISSPLLLMPGSNDAEYTMPGSSEFQVLLKNGSKSIEFPEVLHGWMTRGDRTDTKIDRAITEALRQALDFLTHNLK